jgi:hypothetical protein
MTVNNNKKIKLLNQWREMANNKKIRSIYREQWVIEIIDNDQLEKHYMHSQSSDYQSIRLKELELTNKHYPLLVDFFSSSMGVSFYQDNWFFSFPCPEEKCSGLKIKLNLRDQWLPVNEEQHIDLELARSLANKVIDVASFQENSFFCLNCISEKMHNKENQHLSGEWIWFDSRSESWQLRTMLGDREINLPLDLPAWTSQQRINQELDRLSFKEAFSDIYDWENDDQL